MEASEILYNIVYYAWAIDTKKVLGKTPVIEEPTYLNYKDSSGNVIQRVIRKRPRIRVLHERFEIKNLRFVGAFREEKKEDGFITYAKVEVDPFSFEEDQPLEYIRIAIEQKLGGILFRGRNVKGAMLGIFFKSRNKSIAVCSAEELRFRIDRGLEICRGRLMKQFGFVFCKKTQTWVMKQFGFVFCKKTQTWVRLPVEKSYEK